MTETAKEGLSLCGMCLLILCMFVFIMSLKYLNFMILSIIGMIISIIMLAASFERPREVMQEVMQRLMGFAQRVEKKARKQAKRQQLAAEKIELTHSLNLPAELIAGEEREITLIIKNKTEKIKGKNLRISLIANNILLNGKNKIEFKNSSLKVGKIFRRDMNVRAIRDGQGSIETHISIFHPYRKEDQPFKFRTNTNILPSMIIQIGDAEWIFQIGDTERFPGLKIILKTILKHAPTLDIEYFLKKGETYEKWGKSVLLFCSANNRFPTKKELWEMGIPMDRIEDVIQFLNLQITTEVLPDLEDEEKEYFDTLSRKVIAHLSTQRLDSLTLEDLVLKLDLKIRFAKILIPFINEVLERDIKIGELEYNNVLEQPLIANQPVRTRGDLKVVPLLARPLTGKEKLPLEEISVLQHCDGTNSIDDISRKIRYPLPRVNKIIRKYEKKKWLEVYIKSLRV